MNYQGVLALSSISPPPRHPGGKPVYRPKERHAGHQTLWKRHHTNWQLMIDRGGDPMWGSVLGRLYLAGEITETQANAGKLYAELAANFDRTQGIPRRTLASPAYERRYGSDDEVERNRANKTIHRYERKAKAAKKAWEKAQHSIPTVAAITAVEMVCIHNLMIASVQIKDFATVLGMVAKAFGMLETDHKTGGRFARKVTHKHKVDTVEGVLRSIENWFRDERAAPSHFKLLMDAPEGERGICVYGLSEVDAGPWVRHTALVKVRKNHFLEAELDAMFLKACQARGWIEREGDA